MVVINPSTGREFHWASNPPQTTKARWTKKTMYGQTVTGSIRHIAHLDRLNALSVYHYKVGIEIIQPAFNSSVPASKGTHDFDMCVDLHIPGISWWTQQAFFRRYGLGCWYRPTSTRYGWSNHIHGFTLPEGKGDVNDDWYNRHFKVGIYVDGGFSTTGHLVTSSQIHDYYIRAFGLKDMHNPGSDKSWHPAKDMPGGVKATVFDFNAYKAKRQKIQAAA
jgi:hypothetical protein